MTQKLIEAPDSTDTTTYETLAYVDDYDAVTDSDYAFVAYKERSRSTGEWCVRIRSRGASGAVFEPEAIRLQARATGAQGKPYFVWGFQIEPSAGDPRRVEFRVHVVNRLASAIEMVVQLRNADHSASAEKSVTFPWPTD